MKQSPKGHFYFMISAQIMYSFKPEEGKEPEIGAAPVNCVMWSDLDKIPIAGLARAQQLAQMNFFKKIPNPEDVTIHDVVFLNLIPLGRFTEEEFNRPPQATPEDKEALVEALKAGGVNVKTN